MCDAMARTVTLHIFFKFCVNTLSLLADVLCLVYQHFCATLMKSALLYIYYLKSVIKYLFRHFKYHFILSKFQ